MTSQRSVWQRLTVCFAVLFAATSVMILSTADRAWAGHFIAVEAKVDVVTISNVPYAELRLDHAWASNPGSFTYALFNSAGTNTNISGSVVSSLSATSGYQVIRFNLSSLTTAGLYTISMTSTFCCRVDSFNVTSSAGASYEAGFWFDPSNPTVWDGSPRFTASVITNVRGGDTFSQNLGGTSVNGLTTSYLFVENTGTANSLNGAPVTLTAMNQNYTNARSWPSALGNLASVSSGGLLSIPSAVTSAIASSTYKRLAVKVRLEERDANNVLRGFVTRDIGFTFATSSNVYPTISGVLAGDVITLQPGQTQTVTVTGSDTAGQSLTMSANNLPAWATITAQSGTNPASRTITFSPPLGTSASSRSIEITARDNDGTFPLTTSVSFSVDVVIAPEVVAGNQSITVAWSAPSVDVGQTITNYSVRYSSNNGTNWTEITRNPTSAATSETLTGLVNGATYIVQFAAWVNGVKGSWSASSAAVLPGLPYATTAPQIVGTPTIGTTLTVTDPDGNWTDPRAEAQLVTSYRWQANGVDIAGETGTSFLVTSSYVGAAITVIAERTNSAGTGVSASESVTVPNALLTALGVSAGSLSPAFSSDVFSYTVNVPYGSASVDLTPAFPAGTATVNGTNTASGVARTINTPVGQTSIQVVVTNTASVTYTVVFDQALPAPDISYAVSSVTLAVNVAMGDLTSVNAGGASTNWTVSPALPTGLTISSATGTIGGTPVSATASATYTVTATNATSSDTFDITILVVEAPTFSYGNSVITVQDGVGMTPLLPTITGSPVDSWAISPAIGNGLTFDATSGEIAGTPTVAAAGVQYTIDATNISGTTSFALTIVVGTAPDISYGSSSFELIIGSSAVNLSPVNAGGTVASWSVQPALPAGLVFDTSTGAITGTPSVLSATSSYTITATGAVGSSQFVLSIYVGSAPDISYPSASLSVVAGFTSVSLTPVNAGGAVTGWSVQPALPDGLLLDASTGVISGVATTPSPTTVTYTITATGAVGSSSFNLAITVNQLIIFLPPNSSTPPSADTAPIDEFIEDRLDGSTPPSQPVTVADGQLPEVTPGRWQVMQNGQEVEVLIELLGTDTWQIRGEGFTVQIGVTGDVTGAQLNGVVTVFAERKVKIAGGGYRPGTLVDIWLFSTPTYLGALRVGPDGNFEGSLKVPGTIEAGLHTLQANGISDGVELRSINLGVQLVNDRELTLPVTGNGDDSVLVVAWWVLLMGLLASGGMSTMARRRIN